MSSKMTQRAKILQYLYDNEWITPLDALREFGCMRLAARIGELIRDGYPIESELITDKNRYGDSVRYARYRLAGFN